MCSSDLFLFHLSANGPIVVASLGSDAPPDAMLCAMVHDFLNAETQPRAQNTGDADDRSILKTQWAAVGDMQYRHVLLSHYEDSGYCITGAAVFAIKPGEPFTYPGETASQISRLAHELGDATAMVVHEEE